MEYTQSSRDRDVTRAVVSDDNKGSDLHCYYIMSQSNYTYTIQLELSLDTDIVFRLVVVVGR